MLDTLLVIAGIAVVLLGADRLTAGSVAVARRLRVPEFVIGLTIVAFGTSMPELCVSLTSALAGTADMAVGNVVGSNIFNIFLIVGVCALIRPMAVSLGTLRRDLPFSLIATLALIFSLTDGTLSKGEGLLMLSAFTLYTIYTLVAAHRDEEKSRPAQAKKRFALLNIVVGLALLVLGSNIFVAHATALAHTLGVSEAVIGITILGAGTSLPELATSAVAAARGSTSMALGNVIGSCVFNILLILGLTAVVTPLTPHGITTLDLATLFTGSLLLWLFSATKSTMERWEGAVMTVCFMAYMAKLLVEA